MKLYHGSRAIIEHPEFGKGNVHNDYGLGFYCTESLDLAKEWACVTDAGGYANCYNFPIESMHVLHLTGGEYHILNWLTVLMENRTFPLNSELALEAREYLLKTFAIPYEQYDVICGYRADDSYFSFAKAFLNNTISLKKLERAMVYGKLGVQVVLKSEKAFSALEFTGYEEADGSLYFPKRKQRDDAARAAFRADRAAVSAADDVYMIDILRGRWERNDSRLQRIILR